MILAPVRARRKLTYPNGHRQLAAGPNPVAKARIWAEIGVLQLAPKLSRARYRVSYVHRLIEDAALLLLSISLRLFIGLFLLQSIQ